MINYHMIDAKKAIKINKLNFSMMYDIQIEST